MRQGPWLEGMLQGLKNGGPGANCFSIESNGGKELHDEAPGQLRLRRE